MYYQIKFTCFFNISIEKFKLHMQFTFVVSIIFLFGSAGLDSYCIHNFYCMVFREAYVRL